VADGEARRRRATALLVAAALVAIAAYALWRSLDPQLSALAALDAEDVQRYLRAWGRWAAFGALALMVLHSFLPLPAEVIAAANGMVFGPWLGVALTWSGAMLGAALSFALARWLGRPFVRRVLPARHWQRLAAVSARTGTLLLVRLVPVISFNLVNYAAGIMGVGWWPFLWTTAIGILPLAVAMVLLGYEMLSAPWWAWVLAAAALLGSWIAWRRLAPRARALVPPGGRGSHPPADPL
jgi:uncharacterized membrane protein YdjX (TVP38/TMEM64 family)